MSENQAAYRWWTRKDSAPCDTRDTTADAYRPQRPVWLWRCLKPAPSRPQSSAERAGGHGGYTGKPFAHWDIPAACWEPLVEVVKRNELHTCRGASKSRMGGGERAFGLRPAVANLKCRRLWKNCERKLNTSLQMVVLAFTVLILEKDS